MPRLVIDNRDVELPDGGTILDAARQAGIDIPTLCFLPGGEASTSCMVCVVKVRGQDRFVPACATLARDGMVVESETDEVHEARRMALELLLSDHVGDCIGPCHNMCPAQMDIPRMIRQIAAGELRGAIETVKAHIALPAVLGRICPAPCEKACRRGSHDAPVAICLLKRYAADADLAADTPYLPARQPDSGKRAAIAGAGPAGLAAAYYLLQSGHACTIFDDQDLPGGQLRRAVPEDRLPRDVLDAEIDAVRRLGATFRLGVTVGKGLSVKELQTDFDAVLVAVGELGPGGAAALGLPASKQGVQVDRTTCATEVEGVFAAGSAIRPTKMAVRSVADGRSAAVAIDQYLSGGPVTGERQPFTVRIGKLQEGEIERFLAEASTSGRVAPSGGEGSGFTSEEARAEAMRCLRCDCRKPLACKLREYADAYGASPGRYQAPRRAFEQQRHHPDVIYEPGKCIDCGLCIRIAAEAREDLGLAFVGRGFAVRVAGALSSPLEEALRKVARECAAACPTGALVIRDGADVRGT